MQQSSKSINPSTLISTSLIPPSLLLYLLSLYHTHTYHLSLSHTLSLSHSLSLSLPHVQLSVSQADRMPDPTWEQTERERKRMRRGGIGDQRDYKHCGRSQICLLNNSDEEQRVKKKKYSCNSSIFNFHFHLIKLKQARLAFKQQKSTVVKTICIWRVKSKNTAGQFNEYWCIIACLSFKTKLVELHIK